MLNTVKVPKQFEPIFEKAQKYVSEYFKDRVEDPSRGTIEISGERYLLVRAASLSFDFFETVKNLYKDQGEEKALNIARQLLFDIAHSIGRSDAKNFHKKMRLKNPIEKLSVGPLHFSHSGWAFVDIFPESKPTPDENYFLVYDHPFSFESDAWVRAEKDSGFPVCVMNSGYSSGWCEESFGMPLVASEIMCKAKGDDACRFVMAHPSKIEEFIQDYLKKEPGPAGKVTNYEIPGFFKRKKIEEELKASEEKFRLAFENATDAIFWADAGTGAIVNCNRAAEILLERKRTEIIGCHQTELHPPKKKDYYKEMFKKAIEEGGALPYDLEVITRSGKTKPVSITTSITRVGGISVIQGIFRDISERKAMENALQENEKKYRMLVERMNEGLGILDEYSLITYANDRLCEILGYQREEILGHSPANFFDEDNKRIFEEQIAARKKGRRDSYEITWTTKNGGKVRTIISPQPLFNSNGGYKGSFAVVTDITRLK